jgi:hypothetical protein
MVLAEARWNEGDERGHDAAVDEAVQSALRCGGRLMLRAAARLVPQPLLRRGRGSPEAGLQARLLDLAIATADASPGAEPVVRLQTLGRTGLELMSDGRTIAVSSAIAQLLAYLVVRGGAAPLEHVIADVWPNSGGAAQVRHTARSAQKVFPEGVNLDLSGRCVRVEPAGALVSDDSELIRLAGAAALTSRRRAAEHRAAVFSLASAGPYLPNVEAAWARRRGEQIARVISDCLAADSQSAASVLDAKDLLEPSLPESTRRLLARSALAKGARPDASVHDDDPQRQSAGRESTE